jgi:hypothetical protein
MKTKETNGTRTAKQQSQHCLTKICTKDEQIYGKCKIMRNKQNN